MFLLLLLQLIRLFISYIAEKESDFLNISLMDRLFQAMR